MVFSFTESKLIQVEYLLKANINNFREQTSFFILYFIAAAVTVANKPTDIFDEPK